jgi:hypothetical protein
MWVQHNDPPWADVAPPLPAIPYLPQQPEPAPLSNGHHSVSNAFGPEPSVSNAELVDMVAAPNSLWQVESGKLYRADGRGDVLGVHPADVAELEEMGVKRR